MNSNLTTVLTVTAAAVLSILLFSSYLPASLFCEDIAKCSVNHLQESGLSSQVSFLFSNLFSTEYWPARWDCGSWSAVQGWTSIISDFMIFGSYFGIPITIYYFQRKLPISEILYKDIAILFALFILACGLTHLIDVIIFWQPLYNLSVTVKLVTAIVSALTLILIIRKFPMLMEFKSPAQLKEIIKNQTSELINSENELKRQLELNNRLFKESQHRIKNNLQLIASLIYLKSGEDNTLQAEEVDSLLERISSIGKVNELLLRSEIMNEVAMKPYLEQFIESLKNLESKDIEWKLEADDQLILNSEQAVFSGLICFEFISNSIKHAFKNTEKPVIEISMRRTTKGINLRLSDNGSGGLASESSSGFGLGLIENFIASLNGKSSWTSNPDGTSLVIDF